MPFSVGDVITLKIVSITPGDQIGPPSSLQAQTLGADSIRLTWTPNPGGEPTGQRIERSTDGGQTFGTLDTVAADAATHDDEGLAASTTYHYRIRTLKDTEVSEPSNVAFATTDAGEAEPEGPEAPTGFTATPAGTTEIGLSWDAPDPEPDSYEIERSLNGLSGWTQFATPAGSATTAGDTGRGPGTRYYYRIRSVDGEIVSPWSTVASAQTFAEPEAPLAPENVVAWAFSSTVIRFTFSDTNAGQANYRVERSVNGTTWTTVQTLVPGTYLWGQATGLSAGTRYFLRLTAVNGELESPSVIVSRATAVAVADAPTNLQAVAFRADAIAIDFGRSTNTFQYIERSSDNGETWEQRARLVGLVSEFLDSAEPNTSYLYRARAGNGTGTFTGYTTPVAVTTPAADLPLSAVADLRMRAIKGGQVELTWINDPLRKERRIEIQRSRDEIGWLTVAGNLYPGSARFVDLGLDDDKYHVWRVRYVNESGPGPWATISGNSAAFAGEGTPPPAPSDLEAWPYSDSAVYLCWRYGDDTEDGAIVEMNSDGVNAWVEVARVGKWVWDCYVTGLEPDAAYRFRVRAFNSNGYSSWSDSTNAATFKEGGHYQTDLGISVPPRTLMTPKHRAILQRMKADYDAAPSNPTTFGGRLWKHMTVNYADLSLTAPRFTDYGLWGAIAYQATGNTTYAAGAYARAYGLYVSKDPRVGGVSANDVRRLTIELALTYDLAQAGWTNEQRDNYKAGLKAWAEYCFGLNCDNYRGGFRLSDSDQSAGQYFGLALINHVLDENDPALGLGLLQAGGSAGMERVGGLMPSLDDRQTVANTVLGDYPRITEGGEWIESSQYNASTVRLVTSGLEALRRARSVRGDNTDYHAALRDVSRRHGLMELARFSPDLAQIWQWGDDETGRTPSLTARVATQSLSAGMARGNPTLGPLNLGFASEMCDVGGTAIIQFAQSYLLIDPYAPTEARTAAPAILAAPGMGALLHHDGHDPSDSFFAAIFMPNTQCDHNSRGVWGDFQLYRKGEWALTHPIWYGSFAVENDAYNSTLLCGFGSVSLTNDPKAVRRMIATAGEPGVYSYIAGETHGYLKNLDYFQRPPQCIFENTRSLVYLPSADKKSDAVVVFDRMLASNPNYLPTFDGSAAVGVTRYATGANTGGGAASEQARINFNPVAGTRAMEQWLLHCREEPTITGNAATWTSYLGNSDLKHVCLLPSAATILKDNLVTHWSPPINWNEAGIPKTGGHPTYGPERRWRITVHRSDAPWPDDATPRFTTFLNVVFAADADGGPTCNATLVESSAGAAVVAAHVTRTDLDDQLVAFSAAPSTRSGTTTTFNRVLTSGFTLAWTSTGDTEVYLFDLLPGDGWTVNVDDGGADPLTVSDQGVARITVPGAGAHTLVVGTA
jgi:hypothetical protein